MADVRDKPDSRRGEPHDSRPDVATRPPENASPGIPDATRSSFAAEPLPAMIGDYRVIREIGSGGMGVVYEAEQQRPKRLVALKVIHGGKYVGEHEVKLFEREAQALARLRHPGIAAIYESGRTPDGQHFFAMELVRGDTLKEYLEKTGRSGSITPTQLGERLAIFRKIAEAVTYAHQHGVIHRDLKPSNIIVERELDSSGSGPAPAVPGIKILDFGLARIAETDLAVATIGTEAGKIQGTLPYMSPEQVRGNPDEIDVRSDVYSLGVILYEMLAGRRPYNIHGAMLVVAARIICETPPEPLSKSWSGTKKLDRDLETIVEKALEKPAARRYQSVSALGDDVTRFLAGQPILARPPSVAYQFQKLAARHKVGVGFAAALALMILAFAVVMTVQAKRIAGERDRANREAKTAQQVSEFLVSVFAVSDPFEGRGKSVTAREILDAGSARIGSELRDQPEVRAALSDTMGRVYRNLGMLDKATDLAQTGLTIRERLGGRDTLEAAASLDSLGALKMDKGDFLEAEKLMREALEIRRRHLGAEHIAAAESLSNIGSVQYWKGDHKNSEATFREALAIQRKALGEEDLIVANTLNNLAMALKVQEKFAEATPLYLEALSIRQKILGPNHPLVAQSTNNLAMLYLRVKNYPEAERLFQEALAVNRKALGEVHPEVVANLNNLALLSLERGQLGLAEDYYRQTIAMDEKIMGASSPLRAQYVQSLGVVLTREKKFAEAEEFLRKAVSMKMLTFGTNHYEVATANNLLGACLTEQKKFGEAEPLLLESYSVIKKQFGMRHDRTQRAGLRLVALYEGWGRKDKAQAIQAELEAAK